MYNVTLINKNDGSVDGHKGDCADIQRRSAKHADTPWNFDTTSKYAAKVEYNADFDEATEGWYQINWLPCAKHVPIIDPVDGEEPVRSQEEHKAEKATPASWPVVTTKVGKKWTYVYSDGELVAEIRNDQAAAIHAITAGGR